MQRQMCTRNEYEKLFDSGVLGGRHIERIAGALVEMPSLNARCSLAITLSHYAMLKLYPIDDMTIQVQCPMRIGEHHDPEPDVAVVQGNVRQQMNHPTTAVVAIEVADTVLELSRNEKGPIYAEAKVPVYLIVNLIDDCVEA